MTIKEIREQLHLTQALFSEIFNIPLRTVQSWEQSPDTKSIRKCPDYLIYLFEQIIPLGISDIDNTAEVLSIVEIRKITGLTKPEFAQKYNIPLRNIQRWEQGVRACPIYIRKLLERLVKHSSEQ